MANDASPWPTVTFLGVLCGITFGLVLYSILRRQDGLGVASVAMLPDDLGLGALPTVNVGALPKKSPPLSAARTLTIGVSKPTMVLRATGGVNWRANVRTLSPVASFATFSIGIGSTNSVVVPAGSSQDIWVPAGQYLYATGNQAGVCVSASGGPG
jgi:hypothetical protein